MLSRYISRGAILCIRIAMFCMAIFCWSSLASTATELPNISLHSLPADSMRYAGTVNAPDFPQNLEWLNVAKPLSIKDLRGKVVLLDFWTYCCINCIHIIPDLKKLEAKYANELVVIGVHSAKFSNEGIAENIREAVVRYEIEHPVVNDKDFVVWDAYTARSWPTLILIDPNGKVIGGTSGEGNYDVLDRTIGEIVREFDKQHAIDRTPLSLSLERSTRPVSQVSYPGKVIVDSVAKLLYFTDSNHNRIVITSLQGVVQEVIGAGAKGTTDGDYRSARFFHPQGLALSTDRKKLYVADTDNHLIREVDLPTKMVRTLMGTGKQSMECTTSEQGTALALNSPWDIVVIPQKVGQAIPNDVLFVAMAGCHQVWKIDPKTRKASVYAGSGVEDILDSSLLSSSLAQTSGITADDSYLYIADSETSSIRSMKQDGTGDVRTLIGEGLFEFGDVDGAYPQARLQHCIGVHASGGLLYVADTYNHKIKVVDPRTRTVRALIGTGKRGRADGAFAVAELNEPNGLAIANGRLYIADTNNDALRVADLATQTVTTLSLQGLDAYTLTKESRVTMPMSSASITISPTTRTFLLKLELPEGTKPTPDAPHELRISSINPAIVSVATASLSDLVQTLLRQRSVEIPMQVVQSNGATTLALEYDVYFCEERNEGRCYFKILSVSIPLRIESGGTQYPAITIKAER